MMVFWLGLTTFVTGVLVRRFESCWFDDVCNVGCPRVARTGPAAAHRHRGQDPRVPRPCPAGQAVWSSETGVAFAGENRSILVRILVAVVMVVSTVAIQGRAVVMGVSC